MTCDGKFTVPQTSACNRKHSVADSGVDRRVRQTSRDVDEAERTQSSSGLSVCWSTFSSQRYFGARPCWHLFAKTATLYLSDVPNPRQNFTMQPPTGTIILSVRPRPILYSSGFGTNTSIRFSFYGFRRELSL